MGAGVNRAPVAGRTVYFPTMTEGGARAIAAAFRSVGIDAKPLPPSDEETLALGGRFSSGEECLPLKVTLGDILKLIVHRRVRPDEMAVFMPSSSGPCRFGQYGPFMKMVMQEMGYGDVVFISPSCTDGYSGIGEHADALVRTAWRAVVASDLLQKLLLRIRPYETEKGTADRAYDGALEILCRAIEVPDEPGRRQLDRIAGALREGRALLHRVPADFSRTRPLIGVVGEIFCRLNAFSNDDVMRKVEEAGGECWISDVAEWVWYTNADHIRLLKRYGRHLTLEMFGARLKWHFQRRDEHALAAVFEGDFEGYEEPHDIRLVTELARPYLSPEGVLGEMLLSVGKAVYLHRKGADGVLDINPFSCMNGIVSEAVYPRVSRDCDGMPIRVLYYDGTRADKRYELEIFMELVREYGARKKVPRRLPAGTAAAARGAA